MRWFGVIALAACNQVYGLEPTVLPAADAPPACPLIGTVPTFSKALSQATLQLCERYTTSTTGRAVAMCIEPNDTYLAEGPVPVGTGEDAKLARLTLDTQDVVSEPRIAPEGDELFVRRYITGMGFRIAVFRNVSDNNWKHDHEIALPLDSSAQFGAPSRGPSRRFLVAVGTAMGTIMTEYAVEPDGAYSEVATYTPTDLEVQGLAWPNLSADGRRMVLFSSTATSDGNRQFYADRPDLDAKFGPARPIDNSPRQILFSYMTEDCARLYFSALESVFYMPQR